MTTSWEEVDTLVVDPDFDRDIQTLCLEPVDASVEVAGLVRMKNLVQYSELHTVGAGNLVVRWQSTYHRQIAEVGVEGSSAEHVLDNWQILDGRSCLIEELHDVDQHLIVVEERQIEGYGRHLAYWCVDWDPCRRNWAKGEYALGGVGSR